MKIGVLGLGIIGLEWTRHYHAEGKLAGAWNRTPKPDAPGWTETPEAVTAAADIVQIVVADPPAVRALLQQILGQLKPGKYVVQSSTIDPQSSEEFAAIVASRGARYVEAPFTGSRPAAQQRQNVFFLGGDPADIKAIEPLLAIVSTHRFVIGTGVQAATIKLAMNLNIAAQMQGMAEALVLSRKAGISDDAFFEVLAKNVSYSGLTKLKEPKLRAHDYAPQFSVKHLHKDLRLASGMAGCADYPLLETVREALKTAEARGMADEDFSAIIKLLE